MLFTPTPKQEFDTLIRAAVMRAIDGDVPLPQIIESLECWIKAAQAQMASKSGQAAS